MQKNLPFSNLMKLKEKNNFDNISDIYLYTENSTLIYKTVAVKVIKTDYEYTRLIYKDEEVLNKHLNNLTSNTMYCNENCHIDSSKNVLILQTCYYEPVGSYLLLIAER